MEGGGHGIFPAKSYYEKLLTREESDLPHPSAWILKVPRKVYYFT